MLKNCSLVFSLTEQTNFYIYKNGIIVVSVRDDIVEFTKENCEIFAVSYAFKFGMQIAIETLTE